MGAQVIICPGAREAEAALLAEIERASSAARADPSLLARPVRVVVPSRSLRDQLARALVRSADVGSPSVGSRSPGRACFWLVAPTTLEPSGVGCDALLE